MRRHDDRLVLSSGKTLYANRGIVGINENLRIYQGYDGELCSYSGTEELTLPERTELALYAISLWTRWVESDR